MNFKECLATVVGLSKATCDCPEFAGEPSGSTISLSGWYIDDLELGVPLQYFPGNEPCEQYGVWNLLVRAREDGIEDIMTLLIQALSQSKDTAVNPFMGRVGDDSKANQWLMPNTYAAVQIKPYRYAGAKITINALSLWTDAPDDTEFAVNLYRNNDFTTPIKTFPVTVKHNKANVNTIPEDERVTYDMVDPLTGQEIVYTFVWDTQGYKAWNIKDWCGCGGSKPKWGDYMEAKGGSYVQMYQISQVSPGESYLYGLFVDVTLTCYGTEWICGETNFTFSPWNKTLAKTLQLGMIRKLIGFMLNSHQLNRYTILNAEQLAEKLVRINTEIENRIPWLAEKMPETSTDCYICRQHMRRAAILV